MLIAPVPALSGSTTALSTGRTPIGFADGLRPKGTVEGESRTLDPATTLGSARPASLLTNYGLPSNVVIARLTGQSAEDRAAAAEAAVAPEGAPAHAVPGADPSWGLSIASRYVGAYASPSRAAAAAFDLVA